MALSTQQKAYIALAATSILWGSTWVVSKVGVEKIPGLQLAAIRQLIAGSIFVGFFSIRKQVLPQGKQWLWLLLLSTLMFVGANGLSTWSVKHIPSGLAALIGALYPLCVVLIEMFFFKRRASLLTFIGLFIGIIGIAVVLYENAFEQHTEAYMFGIFLAVIAMLSWSLATIFLARNKYNMNPYYAMGWQMLFGSAQIFLLSWFTNQHIPFAAIAYESWMAIAYLVAAGSIIAFVAFIYTMKHLPTAIASLYAYINPIVAMLIGAVWVNEPLTIYLFFGSIITLFGVYLVNYSTKKLN